LLGVCQLVGILPGLLVGRMPGEDELHHEGAQDVSHRQHKGQNGHGGGHIRLEGRVGGCRHAGDTSATPASEPLATEA